MDPNANLKEQLEIARHLIYEVENVEDMDRDALELVAHDAFRLADLIEALDGWIKGGGFLPAEWARTERHATWIKLDPHTSIPLAINRGQLDELLDVNLLDGDDP